MEQFLSGHGRHEASFSRLLLRLSAKADVSHVSDWLIFKRLGLREQRC